jgi:hypothetical protein
MAGRFRGWRRAAQSRAARRAGWGIADQAISSVTNFSMTLVVARATSPVAFGAFSLALAAYAFLLWVSRSLSTEPFVIRFAATSSDEQRVAAHSATGTALAVGLASPAVVLAVGLVAATGGTMSVVVAMAISMPGLVLQDAYRYVLITAGRARAAAVNDAAWFFIQAALVVLLETTGNATTTSLTGSFGLAATVAAVMGAVQTRILPHLGSCASWVVRHKDLGVTFLIELVAVAGALQLTLVAIAVFYSVAIVGQLRASLLLLGPVTVVSMGVFVVAVQEGVRLRHRSLHALKTLVVALSILMPLGALLWGAGLTALPQSFGSALLRSNWPGARHLLGPVTFLAAGGACMLGPVIGLRSLGAARESLRARLWGVPLIVGGGLLGASLDGAYGAAVLLAVSAWVDALIAGNGFRNALARYRQVGPIEVDDFNPTGAT